MQTAQSQDVTCTGNRVFVTHLVVKETFVANSHRANECQCPVFKTQTPVILLQVATPHRCTHAYFLHGWQIAYFDLLALPVLPYISGRIIVIDTQPALIIEMSVTEVYIGYGFQGGADNKSVAGLSVSP